jgi:putative DNA primase/helicase
MARKDQRLVIAAEALDSDIWLLDTPGGTIDLRTGKTRPGLPDDHLTKITAVGQGGECPKFMAFLDRAMGGDVEMIAFLQRLFGYALTGSTREDVIAFLHGPGRNGKGVFLHTVASLLGEYAKTTRIETFLESQFDRHPTDEADMAGARLVTSDEIPPGRRWDEAKLKRFSGGEPIKARFMRQDMFEYQPQMLLTFSANNKPRLQTVDEAIRARMLLIPFSVVIPKGERDPTLKEQLRAEWGGILAWLVQGCLEWQRGGLRPPAAVLAATEEYLTSEDTLTTWLDERCVLAPGKWAERGGLFASWTSWAMSARESVGTAKQFYEAMRGKHFEDVGREGKRGFAGVQLKPIVYPNPPGQPPFPR